MRSPLQLLHLYCSRCSRAAAVLPDRWLAGSTPAALQLLQPFPRRWLSGSTSFALPSGTPLDQILVKNWSSTGQVLVKLALRVDFGCPPPRNGSGSGTQPDPRLTGV
jgi:hypothetical protein